MSTTLFNKKLLVEGKDDQHVIWALCNQFKIPENFSIIDCEGIEKLIERIPVELKASGIETIGIVVDADVALSSRWQSISQLLLNQGYVLPTILPNDGLIISSTGKVKIGVWIMPNNNINGMIEDFITFLVPEGDKLMSIAKSTLETIESDKSNRYSLIHKSKARIHTWLAWQETPGTPMGSALTRRYLSIEHETCKRFADWLFNTFESN